MKRQYVSFSQSLNIKETRLGKQHIDTAESYNGIGLVYDNLGNYHIAIKRLHRRLGETEKSNECYSRSSLNLAKIWNMHN